jgi:hypothetical protein
MSEKKETQKDQIEVSPEDFQALNKAALDALEGKYGVVIKIRSRAAAIKETLSLVDRSTPINIQSDVGGYDRGFDRTRPGYSRSYDRDRPTVLPTIMETQERDNQPSSGEGSNTS